MDEFNKDSSLIRIEAWYPQVRESNKDSILKQLEAWNPGVRHFNEESVLEHIYAMEPNAGRASWVTERCAGSPHVLSAIVPTGFPSYLRICHPGTRVEALLPDDERGWRLALGGYEEWRNRSFVRWDEVAIDNNRTAHRLMQWFGINPGGTLTGVEPGSAGLDPPREGELTREITEALFDILIESTGESSECLYGLWLGFRRLESAPATFGNTPECQEYALLRGDLRETRDFLLSVHDEGLRAGVRIDTAGLIPNAIWPISREWYLAIPYNRQSSYFGGSEKLAAEIAAATKLETYKAFPEDNIWEEPENPQQLTSSH